MARDPEINVRVKGDASGVESAMSRSQAAVVGFSAAAGTAIANYADRAARALVNVAQATIDQASKLQQSTGAVETVFGQYADSVEQNAARASRAVGLSANAYQELASVLGSQLKNSGLPMEEIAGKTDDLIRLGADLAATYGGSVADAVSAVSSLMRGERDPIEAYGKSINQASIDAYNAARGLGDLSGSAKTAADQQAALAILFEQSSAEMGAFARENGTLANAQEILNASWQDAQAALGEALLPLLTIAAELLSQFAVFVKENSTLVQILAGVFLALAVAVWAANAAFLANPVTWIILAIAALITIIVLLIANWDAVVAKFEQGARQIGDFFTFLGQHIADAWGVMIEGITNAWESFIGWIDGTIDTLIGWIRDAVNWFNDLFSAASNAGNAANSARAAQSAAPSSSAATFSAVPSADMLAAISVPRATSAVAANVAGATMRARMRGQDVGGTTIVVNGALDPNAVAKQVSGLLRGRDARIGLAAAAGVRA